MAKYHWRDWRKLLAYAKRGDRAGADAHIQDTECRVCETAKDCLKCPLDGIDKCAGGYWDVYWWWAASIHRVSQKDVVEAAEIILEIVGE